MLCGHAIPPPLLVSRVEQTRLTDEATLPICLTGKIGLSKHAGADHLAVEVVRDVLQNSSVCDSSRYSHTYLMADGPHRDLALKIFLPVQEQTELAFTARPRIIQ